MPKSYPKSIIFSPGRFPGGGGTTWIVKQKTRFHYGFVPIISDVKFWLLWLKHVNWAQDYLAPKAPSSSQLATRHQSKEPQRAPHWRKDREELWLPFFLWYQTRDQWRSLMRRQNLTWIFWVHLVTVISSWRDEYPHPLLKTHVSHLTNPS